MVGIAENFPQSWEDYRDLGVDFRNAGENSTIVHEFSAIWVRITAI